MSYRARGRVAMVDDDHTVAEMYRIGLELEGFAVTIHPDGDAFLASLGGDPPDVVILDWQLPGKPGDEVLQELRANVRFATLPVLFLSNFPSQMDGVIDRVFAAGALAWLEKIKTTPQVLAERLAAVLDSQPARCS